MKTLFKNLKLSKFSADSINDLLESEAILSSVYLTFRWTSKQQLIFFKLHLKIGDANPVSLLANTIADNSGARTFFIGTFEGGTKIEVSFGILALTKVSKAVAILSQDNPVRAFQVSPKNPGTTQTIDAGARWEDSFTYTILKEENHV